MKYYQIPDAKLIVILENTKRVMNDVVHSLSGHSENDLGEIIADYAYPTLMDEFRKQTKVKNIDTLDEFVNEFLDDIHYGEPLEDYIEELMKEYRVGEDNLMAHRTKSPRKPVRKVSKTAKMVGNVGYLKNSVKRIF